MPERFTFTSHVVLGPKLADWQGTVEAALAHGGQAFQNAVKDEPPPRGNPWNHRTGNLASTVQFQVEGNTLQMGGPFYLPYLLFGTGIYGPRGSRITPTRASVLAIPVSGAANIASAGVRTSSMGVSYGKSGGHLKSRDTGAIFVRSVRGSIWQGKLAEVKEASVNGVKSGMAEQFGE